MMEITNSKPPESEELISPVDKIIRSIVSKFDLAIVQPNQVKAECDNLRQLYQKSFQESKQISLAPLFPLLQKRSGPVAEYVFSFLELVAVSRADLQPIVEALLSSRDKNLALRALDYVVNLVKKDKLKVTYSFIRFIASRMFMDNSSFTEKTAVIKISKLLKTYTPEGRLHKSDPILALYLEEENPEIRRLAAQLLDKTEKGVKRNVEYQVLGRKAAAFFSPYFVYSGVTFTDLLSLQRDSLPFLQNNFTEVQSIIGEKLLGDIISKIGWNRINQGLQAQALTGITIENSPPYMVSDLEASLLGTCSGASRSSRLYLIIACGGLTSEEENKFKNDDEPINRFRSYNLNHASLLNDFLDVGPLDVGKVRDMIRRMDQVVEDYVILFSHLSDECAILPGVYQKIRKKIINDLDKYENNTLLSADLTRIVQSFEEPHSLGTVRTLHGLKRYLHQQGLSMGLKLTVAGRSPNRTVDIIIATDEGIKFVYSKIRFADFEPERLESRFTPNIPFAVNLLVEGFARQMLHGQEQLPNVDIYCYGNEVHYYFGFRNHPAFLRIDYAPPLRGGMIDLQYFGVSNYVLDQHPNIALDAIRTLFQRIEFDIQIDAVHIHARYDKERALALGDLCQKASQLFRMSPYLMDLDWIIGSLDLGKNAKQKVTEAWIDFFIRWGFLPLHDVLTKNRTGIRCGFLHEPTGDREKIWSGDDNYTDIYTGSPPAGFYKDIISVFRDHGLEIAFPSDIEATMRPGQLEVEKRILDPFRLAISHGELIPTSTGLQLESPLLFTRVHEAKVFAELLSAEIEKLAKAIATARLVRQMERSIKFNTTGGVNGYIVQKAVLALRGEEITFYVLRGAKDMIRLAFFIHDQVVYKRRRSKYEPWKSNIDFNAKNLAKLLMANDFIDALPKTNLENDIQKAVEFLEEIKQSVLPPAKTPLRGDKIVSGLKASPGICVGKALFGTQGRNPQDLRGSILIATSIRPEDTTFLYYANGIISTGGGILSHAGLIAMQFHKPALIISGTWQLDSDGREILSFKSLEYKIVHEKVKCFHISIRTDIQEKEYILCEGDLVILNAIEGTMRVLGQESNVLALYEGFTLYNRANELLAAVKNEREILNLRGQILRARHQLENVLRRCSAPETARYGIFELLLNRPTSGPGISYRDKSFLLTVLLNNPQVADDSREYLIRIVVDLNSHLTDAIHKAKRNIPTSEYVFEILFLRLDILHHLQAVEGASLALVGCDVTSSTSVDFSMEDIEKLIVERLSYLQKELLLKINQILNQANNDYRLRHLVRQSDRLNDILHNAQKKAVTAEKINQKLSTSDQVKANKFANQFIIESTDCGFELFNYIGWKAANLAEIERLSNEKLVPPWFTVTDKAFQEVLKTTVKIMDPGNGNQEMVEVPLQDAIGKILQQEDLKNLQKSMQIRNLWEQIQLPDALRRAVIQAYHNVVGALADTEATDRQDEPVYVAVRSSSLEEDTETAAHVGEFETYLYIQGDDQLLYYLKRTWSGLWTERAIHNRALMGGEASLKGGGVIVQRMVNSRVSGVLQTVNIPKSNIREMVINAGLGLGEGVVSGTVAADQVTVTKGIDPEKELLRISYITSDKTTQIKFNHHVGFGTIRLETIYHQRLRPALEYVELCELVRNATLLEKVYGYPLDIEFGIEEDHLWILQARPVASFLSVLNETIERFPING